MESLIDSTNALIWMRDYFAKDVVVADSNVIRLATCCARVRSRGSGGLSGWRKYSMVFRLPEDR